MINKYENPINGYTRTDGSALCWLWACLFGPLYFMFRGNWGWVFIYMMLAIVTLGLAYFIVPFFTRRINATDLLRKGYKKL